MPTGSWKKIIYFTGTVKYAGKNIVRRGMIREEGRRFGRGRVG
jgi:hypothetical protein